MKTADRDCANCRHKHPDGCDSWECEFEPIYKKEEPKTPTFAEIVGEYLGRIVLVLLEKKVITARDALYIKGDMNLDEWKGDFDE